jgi:hypothetical protein
MAELKRVRRKALALSAVLLRMTPAPVRTAPPRDATLPAARSYEISNGTVRKPL